MHHGIGTSSFASSPSFPSSTRGSTQLSAYLLLGFFLQERLDDFDNGLDVPGLVDEMNGSESISMANTQILYTRVFLANA